MSYTSSDYDLVKCVLPSTSIKRSDAVEVKCVSGIGTAAGKRATLKFTFTSGEEVKVITVNAVVYLSDATLYSSSPMGDMLPLERGLAKSTAAAVSTSATGAPAEGLAASFAETATETKADASKTATDTTTKSTAAITTPVDTTPITNTVFGVESVADCTTHFCTYDQSKAAYTRFVRNLRQVVDYIGSDDENLTKRINLICNSDTRSTNNEYSKTIVMQVANMNQTFNFLNEIAFDQFGTVTNTAGEPAFAGCGIYKITAKPQFCITKFTSAAEFKENLQIDIAAVNMAPCKETLANSMLLMGNDAELVVGNELTKGASEITCALDAAAKLDIGKLMSGPIKIGVYKDEANKHDDETAAALLAAGFGTYSDPSLFNNGGKEYPLLNYDPLGRVRVASSFEDDLYCMREGGLILTETAAVLNGPSIAMLFSGVGSVPASIDLASTIVSTISLTAVEVAGGKSLGCALMCSTLMSSITSKVQMLSVIKEMGIVAGPTGVAQLTKVLGYTGTSKAALLSLGKTHALTAGLTGLGVVGAYTTSGSHTVTALTGTAVQYYSGSASVYNTLFNQKQQYIRYLMQNKLAPNYAIAESRTNNLMTNGLTQSTSIAGTTLGAALAKPSSPSSAYDAISELASKVSQSDELSILNKLQKKVAISDPAFATVLDGYIQNYQQSTMGYSFEDVLIKVQRTGSEANCKALVETFTEANLKGVNVESILSSKGITASAATTADIIALRADYIPEGITNQLASKTTAARAAELTKLATTVERDLAGKVSTADAASIVGNLKAASKSAGNLIDTERNLKLAYGLLEKNGLGELAEDSAKNSGLYKGLTSKQIAAKITAVNPSGSTLTQKVTSSLNKETAAKYLSQAPVFLATLVAFMMMDCNFEPTQAILDPGVQNHFVIYTKKRESSTFLGVIPVTNVPSMMRVCFADTTQSYLNVPFTVTKDSNCVNIEDSICPAGKSYEACLALTRNDKVNGIDGYTLFLSTDEKLSKKGSTELLSAVFNSYTKPWDSKKDPVFRSTDDLTVGWLVKTDSNTFKLINS